MNSVRRYRFATGGFACLAALLCAVPIAASDDPVAARQGLVEAKRVVLLVAPEDPPLSVDDAQASHPGVFTPVIVVPASGAFTAAYGVGNILGNVIAGGLINASMDESQRNYERAKLGPLQAPFAAKSAASVFADEFAAAMEAQIGRRPDRIMIKPKITKEQRGELLKAEVRAYVVFLKPRLAFTRDKSALHVTTELEVFVNNGGRGKTLRSAEVAVRTLPLDVRSEGLALVRYAADGGALLRAALRTVAQDMVEAALIKPRDDAPPSAVYEIATPRGIFVVSGRELARSDERLIYDDGDGAQIGVVHYARIAKPGELTVPTR